MAETNPFRAELERRRRGGNPFAAETRRRGGNNPFQAELERRRAEAAPQPSGLTAFGRAASGRVLDNILAAPQGILSTLAGGIVPPGPTRQSITESVAGAIPAPQVADIVPGGRAADERFQEAAPVSTMLGEAVGDAGTLLLGRAPVRAARRQAPPKPPRPVHTGTRKVLDDVVDSKLVRDLRRGGLRVGEAGLEGAVLAAMNDDDPVTGMALAAGQQAGSSLALRVGQEFFGGGSGKFFKSVAMSAIALQLLKETVPGGKDFFLESTETAIKKVIPVAILGGLSAFAGGGRSLPGRVGRSIEKNLPTIADAITTIPRGSLQSLMRELVMDREEGDGSVSRVLETFNQNPDAFSPAVRRRIERALTDGRQSVSKTINELMRFPEFRRRITGE